MTRETLETLRARADRAWLRHDSAIAAGKPGALGAALSAEVALIAAARAAWSENPGNPETRQNPETP